jgi:hypothetical protein
VTPEALHRWQAMRGPESHWRQSARAVMIRVVRELRDAARLDDDAALLAAVDAAYPFGERKYLPYKMWLLERKIFRDACSVPSTPTADEASACAVARDMLEEQRDESVIRALLDEQAPNRLARKCLACGARAGEPCIGMSLPIEFVGTDAIVMLVPHEARLTGHLDAGPLFSAPPEVAP